MTRDQEADHHWAAVSNLTQLAEGRRPADGPAARLSARQRVGLALVRAGLAVAPLRVEDIDEHLDRVGPPPGRARSRRDTGSRRAPDALDGRRDR